MKQRPQLSNYHSMLGPNTKIGELPMNVTFLTQYDIIMAPFSCNLCVSCLWLLVSPGIDL